MFKGLTSRNPLGHSAPVTGLIFIFIIYVFLCVFFFLLFCVFLCSCPLFHCFVRMFMLCMLLTTKLFTVNITIVIICDFFLTGTGCTKNLGGSTDSEFFNMAGLVRTVTLSFASPDCLLMLNFTLDLN